MARQPVEVSFVVPAYNEGRFIVEVLDAVLALELDCEVLVVDDGSADDTVAVVEGYAATHPAVRLLRHEHNRGKGAGVRTGIAASTGAIVVIQDADREYDPADVPKLIAPLQTGVADVVFGSRLRGGGEPQRAHLFWHYLGNRALSLLTNVLFNTTISDMEVGYKAFRGEIIRSTPLESDDFRIEPEMTAKMLKIPGIRLYEVPISYYGRTYDEGKKITWRDGVLAVGALLRYRVVR